MPEDPKDRPGLTLPEQDDGPASLFDTEEGGPSSPVVTALAYIGAAAAGEVVGETAVEAGRELGAAVAAAGTERAAEQERARQDRAVELHRQARQDGKPITGPEARQKVFDEEAQRAEDNRTPGALAPRSSEAAWGGERLDRHLDLPHLRGTPLEPSPGPLRDVFERDSDGDGVPDRIDPDPYEPEPRPGPIDDIDDDIDDEFDDLG